MTDLGALAGFAGFTAIVVALGAWVARAQDDYLRAYQTETGIPAPTTGQILRTVTRPWQLFTRAPLTKIARATGTRQQNARLEQLRQTFLTRRLMAFLIAFALFLVYGSLQLR
jgi:hypothetical protein